MLRLANIRIGTKLAIMSGLGILLVIGMIVTQMFGNSSVRNANDAATVEELVAREVQMAKASERGMQIGARDIRLARSSEDLQAALKYLDERHQAAHKWLDPLVAKLHAPENRARIEKIKSLVDEYFAGIKEIAAVKTQMADIDSKAAADAATRIAALDQQAVKIARERTLPIAAEMEKLIEQADENATERAQQENE